MIQAIYTEREFFVRDAGCGSLTHQQHFGISQGCPLSPFLFVILMTCLMHDASELVDAKFGETDVPYLVTRSLLYADDTLIIEADAEIAQYFMECISRAGAEYGLQFNWSKLELLRARHEGHVHTATGERVKEKDSIVYLGGLLSADGRIHLELSRRLGMATADFSRLEVVWKHANITRQRKVQIYKACVLQKLLYCLHTAWLTQAERRKLDGFHARCVRKVYGIQHSYISRVSTSEVLEQASIAKLSAVLLERQLHLFAKVARKPDDAPERVAVFQPSSYSLREQTAKRQQGRPRQAWARCVHAQAVAAAGGETSLHEMLADTPHARASWSQAVRSYCYS